MLGGCMFQSIFRPSMIDPPVFRLVNQCPNVVLHNSLHYLYNPSTGRNMELPAISTNGPKSSMINLGPGKTFRGLFVLLINLDFSLSDPWCSYFRKFEHFHPHPDYPLVDASEHGSAGPVHVGFFNTITEWCSEFVDSCITAGIRRTHDFNAPHGLIGASRVSCCHCHFLSSVCYKHGTEFFAG